jgi:UDP-glucose 4-epimerase
VVEAVLTAYREGENAYEVYNVATGDYITVTEIAQLAVEVLGFAPESVQFRYSGGDRGWKGDVPVVRLATERIRAIGWRCQRSTRRAVEVSMRSMLNDIGARRM